MVAIENVLLAAESVFALALTVIAVLALRRAKDTHLAYLAAAFGVFFLKALLFTVFLFAVDAGSSGGSGRPHGGGEADSGVPASAGAAQGDRLPHGTGGGDPQTDPGASARLAVDALASSEENASRGPDRARRAGRTRISRGGPEVGRAPHDGVRARDAGPG